LVSEIENLVATKIQHHNNGVQLRHNGMKLHDYGTQIHNSDASRLVLLLSNLGTVIGKFTNFLYFLGNLVFEILNLKIIINNFIVLRPTTLYY
jgi:hypothetical protein